MLKSMLVAAVSVASLGVVSAEAATLTLRQGLDGYAGTRDDAQKQNTANDYSNLDDGLYAYSTISGPYLGTVVGFDISSIPSGATINSVSLTMSFNEGSIYGDNTPQTYAIKNPTAQWIEGQVSYYFAQNTGSGVMWNPTDAPFGAGGTGITMANEPGVIDTQSIVGSGPFFAGAGITFNVTSLVQGWYDNSIENRGFAIVNVSAAGQPGNMFWAGKANVNENWRPTLVIDYTPVPEPTSLLGAGVGAMLLLRRRR